MSTLIALANSRVPMPVACREAGLDIPDTYRDGGTKCYCPWGEFSHSDGGRDKAFRVWPDHAWCFAERRYFSPVSLCAEIWEVSREQAAVVLLDKIGLKPAGYAQHWQRAEAVPVPDSGALAQALRNYCTALAPPERLTEPRAAGYLAQCLGYITEVKNEADAARWLELAKAVMASALGGPDARQEGRAEAGRVDHAV